MRRRTRSLLCKLIRQYPRHLGECLRNRNAPTGVLVRCFFLRIPPSPLSLVLIHDALGPVLVLYSWIQHGRELLGPNLGSFISDRCLHIHPSIHPSLALCKLQAPAEMSRIMRRPSSTSERVTRQKQSTGLQAARLVLRWIMLIYQQITVHESCSSGRCIHPSTVLSCTVLSVLYCRVCMSELGAGWLVYSSVCSILSCPRVMNLNVDMDMNMDMELWIRAMRKKMKG
ncbi:hypothetical protein EYC84_008466 [Monilinia fructicola]|uniref:Uncharacterized protein n=1 Tax=Monilinia fructicola TaxID=38448 RepID=A0A5M9JH15_MONFR|nr:hypothetical protein EYC84_008466 [Monilinia fructicola]